MSGTSAWSEVTGAPTAGEDDRRGVLVSDASTVTLHGRTPCLPVEFA
ncbi:MAG: hypothetical protein HQM06_16400 [Magnetococcales bacterium]|nr:hypothetical protein [Magnetococcales bacterium]